MAINDDAVRWAGDALTMQRVGHHLGLADQPVEHAPFGEADSVTQGELFLDCGIGWHAVVHAAGQIADFGIQTAAKGHVHLLKATTDAEDGLAARDAGADQRQSNGIAVAVECAMCGGFILAIFGRMHIGPPSGQHKPVAGRQQILDIHIARIGGDDQGHAPGHVCHRLTIHRTGQLHREAVVDDEVVADDADDRFADAGHVGANARVCPIICTGCFKEKNGNAAYARQLGLMRAEEC